MNIENIINKIKMIEEIPLVDVYYNYLKINSIKDINNMSEEDIQSILQYLEEYTSEPNGTCVKLTRHFENIKNSLDGIVYV